MGTIQIDGSTPKLTIGNATAEDALILFDGNAQDFYIALDDSADDLLIGLGSTVGTTPAISIDENLAIKTYGDITMTGTTPVLTIGDAGAEDTAIVFDGNAQDFYIGLDDSADDLVIGLGSTVGTTPAISINSDRDVTISDGAIDFDVASHDTSNGLKLGGTLVTATAAELNIMDGVTSTAAEINLIDGGTARGTTALADGDGILINDGGTMRMTNVTTVKTYMAGGGLVFLEGVDGDQGSATTINFTQVFSSDYNMYRVIGSFQIAGGSDLYCLWLNSSDAEQDASNYFTTMHMGGRADGGGSDENKTDGFWDPHAYGFIVGNAHGGDAKYKHSIDFILHPDHDPSTTTYSSYHGTYGGTTNTGSVKRTVTATVASIYENTADLTGGGFCIKVPGSNFDYADIAIYGIKNS